MPPCKEPTCVGLAVTDGLCTLHAAGYHLHDGTVTLQCDTCRRAITAGTWYRRTPESLEHVKRCTPHPDVLKDRAKATDPVKA